MWRKSYGTSDGINKFPDPDIFFSKQQLDHSSSQVPTHTGMCWSGRKILSTN